VREKQSDCDKVQMEKEHKKEHKKEKKKDIKPLFNFDQVLLTRVMTKKRMTAAKIWFVIVIKY
jgi:hypothetical protein